MVGQIMLLQVQDFKMFGIPSTPVAFLEFDLEMKVSILSGVMALLSKERGAEMWAVIVWML